MGQVFKWVVTLDALNTATHACVEQEFHRDHHSEIGTRPLLEPLSGRPQRMLGVFPPTAYALVNAFRIEVKRRRCRSDGAANLVGTRFEISADGAKNFKIWL